MDQVRFEKALAAVTGAPRQRNGIGTLGERTLHAVLKHYYEPWEENHETKIGGYVADIVGENGIIEIQTRNFNKLREKLKVFLEASRVTVVYPIAAEKWLCWIDQDTGETTGRRKSPKRGGPWEAFYELYQIKPMLAHPHFSLRVVLLDMVEYRDLNGWSHDKKRGSTRHERIPIALREEIAVESLWDYEQLVPGGLPDPFTTKDWQKAARTSPAGAQAAVNVLFSLGAALRVGKRGNAYQYRFVWAEGDSEGTINT